MCQTIPLSAVVDNDLCIACGACLTVCPEGLLKPHFDQVRGSWEVRATDSSACSGCGKLCVDVCPSISLSASDFGFSGKLIDDPIGPCQNIYTAYSPHFQNDTVSSSGGVVRALVEHSLRQHKKVICLTQSENDYTPSCISDISDLAKMPGSIYHSIDFCAFPGLVLACDSPCVVVGTPCQLEGLRKCISAAGFNFEDKVELAIGLICGWMYSTHSLRCFLSFKDIGSEFQRVSYRGGDKIGKLKIQTSKGVITSDRRHFDSFKDRMDYLAAFSSILCRLRCRVCRNHLNIGCDIAVGDAWVKRKSQEKCSLVLARTGRGLSELQEIEQAGSICLETGSVDDILVSQSENLVYGIDAQKFARFLSDRGIKTPDYPIANPNLSKPGISETMSMHIEMALRGIVRSGRYLFYRQLYTTRFLFRRIYGRLSRHRRH